MNVISKALAAAALFAGTTTAANAAVIVNGNSYGAGQSFTLFFDGYGGAPAVIPGLTSNIKFTVSSISGSQYKIDYLIDNTSSAPITGSRVSIFGFQNVTPNYSSASVTGIFDTVGTGNVPNFGTVEFCATTVNCSGGGSAGVDINTTYDMAHSGGTVTLNFAAPGDITLDDFFVRYQSIAGAGEVTSAIGREIPPPPAVPEPATWALMLAGFGAAGVAMRRSRRQGAIAQLA